MNRILIVDDRKENLYYLSSLMKGHQWLTATAQDGHEALILARTEPFDVIVSDLLMPQMDGFTLLSAWKADENLKKIPFVVYTATYTESEDELLALSLGADAFFLKPMPPEEFFAKIQKVVEQAKVHPPKVPGTSVQSVNVTAQLYNESLVRKLEQKSLQLEEANLTLKKEQRELRMLENAIQLASQGFIIADATREETPIIYASAGVTTITGYSKDEILGKNCRMFQGVETSEDAKSMIRAAIKDVRPCNLDIVNYRKDGTPFWNRLSISPVKDGTGQLIQFVGVLTDCTQQKSLEVQLMQSQKMRAIGTLADGVAHDFNNLLAVIGLHVQNMLRNVEENSPLRKGLENILKAHDRGADLTRQLLAVTRKRGAQLKPVDIDKTISNFSDILNRLVGDEIQLETTFGEGEKIVLGDLHLIEQLITNLVLNARDAISNHGRIFIFTNVHDEFAKISVRDNGVGMNAETQSRIFEPFFTTKEQGKGAGLGLSIVDGLVRQINGRIEVKSAVGQGTTFEVYLPLNRA